jgi:hypothetical protein
MDSFLVSSLRLAKQIVQRFGDTPAESDGLGNRAKCHYLASLDQLDETARHRLPCLPMRDALEPAVDLPPALRSLFARLGWSKAPQQQAAAELARISQTL